MKPVIHLFPVLFLFLFISCNQKDPCEGVDCRNGGTCNEGTCECPFLYEDERCRVQSRIKYYGTYVGELLEDDGDVLEFEITLGKHPDDPAKLYWQTGNGDVEMTLTSGTTAEIPAQLMPPNLTYEGNVTFLSRDEIKIEYSLSIPLKVRYYVFTGTK